MSDPRAQLMSMVQSLIKDDETTAADLHHQYMVSKTAQVAGFASPEVAQVDDEEPTPDFDETTEE